MFLLILLLLFIYTAHDMKAHGIPYYQVQSWSHASWLTNHKTLRKNFCQSITETPAKRKRRKTIRKPIAKFFVLHANTIIRFQLG